MAFDSCPKCGAPIASTERFCHACGAELPAGTFAGDDQEGLEKEELTEEEKKRRKELKKKKKAAKEAARLKAEEEARMRKKKQAQQTAIIAVAASILVLVGGFFAFKALNRSVDDRMDRAATYLVAKDYPAALAESEKVFKKVGDLDEWQVCRLSELYKNLSLSPDESVQATARTNYWAILRSMVASENLTIKEYCNKYYADDVVTIRLSSAKEFFDNGKLGDAKALCEEVYRNRASLKFEHKCELASLFAAIGKVENDQVSKGKCAWLYNQAMSFNEDKAREVFAKNDAVYGTNIEEIANGVKQATATSTSSRTVQYGRNVVVTGTHVRLRRGPSLQSEIVTDFYGKPVYPNKGEYLEYVDESTDFYKVRYHGDVVWISKDYTSLVR